MTQADLLMVGDSHGAALHEGARLRGMQSDILYLSGNHWHEGNLGPDRRLGITAGRRPGVRREIAAFASRQGGTVFPQGRPVLASIGYHLGRIAPLLGRFGHLSAEGPWLSQAFLDGWLLHHRGQLWQILQRGARTADLVVVAPPVLGDDPVSARLAGRITAALRARQLRVFDPREEPDWMAAPLPDHLRAADGVHARPDYGAELMGRLQARGWLKLPW